MSNYSEKRITQDYEKYKICECGRKSFHASGLCWECFDKRPGSAFRDIREMLIAELQRVNLDFTPTAEKGTKEYETERKDWCRRCKEYTLKKGGLGSILENGTR